MEDVLAEARANRPELRRLRLQQEINSIDLRYFKDQTRPRIDLHATLSSEGAAGSPAISYDRTTGRPKPPAVPSDLSGGYFKSLGNLLNLKTRSIVVGVTVELPLRSRTAKADLATAQIERELLTATWNEQELNVVTEVRNAAQSVETAHRLLLASRTARESAELQLAGRESSLPRRAHDDVPPLQRENQLVNARNRNCAPRRITASRWPNSNVPPRPRCAPITC
jgi:HAE1 family hydrophobic/amphiphilic exporter-1